MGTLVGAVLFFTSSFSDWEGLPSCFSEDVWLLSVLTRSELKASGVVAVVELVLVGAGGSPAKAWLFCWEETNVALPLPCFNLFLIDFWGRGKNRGATQNLAQTRKGKNTAGKEKRQLARILEKARKRLSRQNSTKKCVNVRGERPQFYKKDNNFRNYVLKWNRCFLE